MINEQRELKKIERDLARLVAGTPHLHWVVEEQRALSELLKRITSISASSETLAEEEWANDIEALERERREFAPELTPEEARSIFFSKMLGGEILAGRRELPGDDQFILAVGLTVYIFEKKRRILREEYRALAAEYNRRLQSLWEEVSRLRSLDERWLAKLDELVSRRGRYEHYLEQGIGKKLVSANQLLGQAYYSVCSSLTYHRLQEAVGAGQFEAEPGELWPTKRLVEGTASGMFQLRPPESADELTPEEETELAQGMFEQCDHLSELDADVLDVLFAYWQLQAKSEEDDGVALVDHILKLRNIRPKLGGQARRGGFDRKQREEVVASINRLESIWVKVRQPVKRARSGRPRNESMQGHLLVVTGREGSERPDGPPDVRFIVFQPGAAFKPYLLGPGRQTALLASQTLKYNWRTHALEKRMARYLGWQWRVRARRREYARPYRVRTLLDAIHLPVDDRNPSRTLDRFEKVLDRLREDGIIDRWEYGALEEDIIDRKKGWMEKWFATLVSVEPPAVIEKHYDGHIRGT